MKFYLDTAIWLDVYEDRIDRNGKPLGEYGSRLLYRIVEERHELVLSDITYLELKNKLSDEQINGMLAPFSQHITIINTNKKQNEESKKIGKERHVPKGDALHAILARDHSLELITRDKHFLALSDICPHNKPEDII